MLDMTSRELLVQHSMSFLDPIVHLGIDSIGDLRSEANGLLPRVLKRQESDMAQGRIKRRNQDRDEIFGRVIALSPSKKWG